MTPAEILSMIKSNAVMAIDQRASYASLEESLSAYYDNVLDTIVEMTGSRSGVNFETYRHEVRAEAARVGVSLVGTTCAIRSPASA
jgi:hypothetical protein